MNVNDSLLEVARIGNLNVEFLGYFNLEPFPLIYLSFLFDCLELLICVEDVGTHIGASILGCGPYWLDLFGRVIHKGSAFLSRTELILDKVFDFTKFGAHSYRCVMLEDS